MLCHVYVFCQSVIFKYYLFQFSILVSRYVWKDVSAVINKAIENNYLAQQHKHVGTNGLELMG